MTRKNKFYFQRRNVGTCPDMTKYYKSKGLL